MSNLQKVLQEIEREYKAAPEQPFPYEDLRRMTADLPGEFGRLGPDHSLSADLNAYLAFIAGLASGGIQRLLGDPVSQAKVRSLLRKPFFTRFPEYKFLERIDLSKYPRLEAELTSSERLRRLLVAALELSQQSPATIKGPTKKKEGWKKVQPQKTRVTVKNRARPTESGIIKVVARTVSDAVQNMLTSLSSTNESRRAKK